MISNSRLEELVEISHEELDRKRNLWESGQVPEDHAPTFQYGLGGRYRTLALSHALLGNGQEARDAYVSASEHHLESVRLHRTQRDEGVYENEPAVLVRALYCAQFGRDVDLLSEVAREALAINKSYLDHYAPGYDEDPFRYYNAKLYAAIVQETDDQQEILEHYRDAISQLEARKPRALETVYAGIIESDRGSVNDGLTKLLDLHDETIADSVNHPRKFVAQTPAALYLLVRQRGLSVHLKSQYIPEVLLTDSPDGE